MIEILRLILPLLLLLYFLVKGIKSPLFFLGIPFLIFMRESIFFSYLKIFSIPGKLLVILGFIWLVIFWILFLIIRIYKKPHKIYNTLQLNGLDFCVIGLVIITLIGLGTTISESSQMTGVFKEFINLISLFAGFFIIKNWASFFEPEELEKFLLSLVILNSVAAFLYILHQGLHFKIYLEKEYLTAIFNGQIITRTFWFMPQLPFLAVAFCLINWKKNPFVFTVLLFVNSIATVITYFRSFSIILVSLFLLYSLLIGLKSGKYGMIVKNILLYSLSGILFILILTKVFPANTNYIIDRFSQITNPQLARGPNNLDIRFTMSKNVISGIDDNKKIIGMGSVTEYQTPMVSLMKESLADVVWTGVIFRWGFVGLLFFIFLNIFSVFKAFTLFMKSEGVVSNLALLLLLYIFSQIIESFIDWTFMSEHGFATGLWYFALLSLLLGYKNSGTSPDGNKYLLN